MKSLKTILGICLATATFGGAVAAGAATFDYEAQPIQQTEAANADVYYLTGSFNDWSTDPSRCFRFDPHGTNEVHYFGMEFTGNNTFKALKQTGGQGALSWQGNITGKGSGNNCIESPSGINTYATGSDAGIHYNNDSTTNYFNIYYNFNTNHFYVDYTYKLQIGSKTSYMGANPSNGSEIYGTISDAVAGSSVSVTYFNDSTPGTINLGSNDKPSNNLSSNKKIKVGGTVSLYMKSSNWSDAWVTGYSPSYDVDGALENFCNEIITATISGSTCNVTNWSNVENKWNSVKSNATLLNAFNDASATYGKNVSYTNVVNEARTRYGYLHSKFGVTLSNATNPSSSLFTLKSKNNTSIYFVLITSTCLIVSAGLSYFLLKKKKKFN